MIFDDPAYTMAKVIKDINKDLIKSVQEGLKGLIMPDHYTNGYYFFKPMTVIFGGNEYQVEHIDRSFEYNTLANQHDEILEITARRHMTERTRCATPKDYYCKDIKNVIFNGPATIIFWGDGTKTTVKLSEGDKNDPKVGLIYAIAKKKFGNNSRIHKEIDPFVSSNAQRIAILKYIVAKDDFDIDKIYEHFKN